MVIAQRKLDRPLGVADSSRCIALSQSLSRAVHLDRRRETAVFLLVGDDHLRRTASGFFAMACRWLQPPLGVAQPAVDSLELAAYQQGPGKVDAEHRPGPNHFVGEH